MMLLSWVSWLRLPQATGFPFKQSVHTQHTHTSSHGLPLTAQHPKMIAVSLFPGKDDWWIQNDQGYVALQ